jgi:hypothetical protein
VRQSHQLKTRTPQASGALALRAAIRVTSQVYELEDADAATRPAYMRKEPTEWGKSIMGRWKEWSRSVWVDVKA